MLQPCDCVLSLLNLRFPCLFMMQLDLIAAINVMEMLQAAIVFFVALSVVLVLTATSVYKDNSFGSFKGFSILRGGGSTYNRTDDLLSGGPNATVTNGFGFQNLTHDNLLRRENITTRSEVIQGETNQNGKTMEGRAMNITAAYEGSRNDHPLPSSINNSTSQTGNHDNKDALVVDDEKHKLIDGLLASGYKESSCISRLKSHLYRKPSPHKPSPYLISKLRNYEAIHRRCGPNSRAYKRAMKKFTSSNKNHISDDAAKTMCKYIVWTAVNGLGNQILSMAATFLYAVLTDRVLLVRFGSDMHGLFCEPFLNSTWTLPRNSPFWIFDNVETYERVLSENGQKGNHNWTTDFHVPPALFLNLAHTKDDPERFFHCDHNQELLKKVSLLIVMSDQYFAPSMFMTPSFSIEMNKMFPEKDTIFHHLGRYLFHPSNEAWGKISRFYQAYLAKADERIGLQVRVFSPHYTPQKAIMDLLLNCTIENKILPQVGMQNSLTSSNVENQTLKAVLVASLYPQFGENLRDMYSDRPTVTGEVIGVYQPSHEEKQKHFDNLHNMKAWIDMYLLSLCDVLVTTSVSTFGYVAQGLGGLKPWLLHSIAGNDTYFPACKRDMSPEPCYHFPPMHACSGEVKEHFASSFPNMHECKDFTRGVKLFNGSAQL